MSDMEEIIARAVRDTHGTPADIAQALTQAGCGRWKVKPLVWHDKLEFSKLWMAEATEGLFEVRHRNGRFEGWLTNDALMEQYRHRHLGNFPTFEAAKAACEADHVKRVMAEMEEVRVRVFVLRPSPSDQDKKGEA